MPLPAYGGKEEQRFYARNAIITIFGPRESIRSRSGSRRDHSWFGPALAPIDRFAGPSRIWALATRLPWACIGRRDEMPLRRTQARLPPPSANLSSETGAYAGESLTVEQISPAACHHRVRRTRSSGPCTIHASEAARPRGCQRRRCFPCNFLVPRRIMSGSVARLTLSPTTGDS
jgi:hypothetical protein